jgi:flagellar biosynthesis chaperone FliJ
MTPTDKLDLQISEDVDGSATVIMPEGEAPPQENAPQDDDKDSRLVAGDNDDDDGDNTPDADPEREKLRQARREERQLKKKIHREKAKESNHLINMLKKQNEAMAQRVAELEKRTAGADMARMDKAIEDAQLRLQYAKLKIAEATKAGDGQGVANAQEAWYDARRNLESLEAMRKKSTAEPRSNVPQAPDPRLQRHASDWMTRNEWYDPNGRDTDSKIAAQIDAELSDEGWDATSEEYWDELDNRLSKYLPHRYGSKQESAAPARRPRTPVTGSGRESSPAARPGEFRLSPDRVKAIKEAGKWDDPVERQKMVRRYAEYDKSIGLR